jgi:hypothetical protein
MLVTPSFGAGYAVFLDRTRDSSFVVSRELRHDFPPDSFGPADRPMSAAGEEAFVSRFRPLVKASSNPVPDSTAQMLARVWSGMLRRRVRMNGWSGVDGQRYFFSRGGLDTGHIWSPAPWTLPGRLVTLGEALIVAAAQPDEAPLVLDRALRIVTDLAQSLARSVAS